MSQQPVDEQEINETSSPDDNGDTNHSPTTVELGASSSSPDKSFENELDIKAKRRENIWNDFLAHRDNLSLTNVSLSSQDKSFECHPAVIPKKRYNVWKGDGTSTSEDLYVARLKTGQQLDNSSQYASTSGTQRHRSNTVSGNSQNYSTQYYNYFTSTQEDNNRPAHQNGRKRQCDMDESVSANKVLRLRPASELFADNNNCIVNSDRVVTETIEIKHICKQKVTQLVPTVTRDCNKAAFYGQPSCSSSVQASTSGLQLHPSNTVTRNLLNHNNQYHNYHPSFVHHHVPRQEYSTWQNNMNKSIPVSQVLNFRMHSGFNNAVQQIHVDTQNSSNDSNRAITETVEINQISTQQFTTPFAPSVRSDFNRVHVQSSWSSSAVNESASANRNLKLKAHIGFNSAVLKYLADKENSSKDGNCAITEIIETKEVQLTEIVPSVPSDCNELAVHVQPSFNSSVYASTSGTTQRRRSNTMPSNLQNYRTQYYKRFTSTQVDNNNRLPHRDGRKRQCDTNESVSANKVLRLRPASELFADNNNCSVTSAAGVVTETTEITQISTLTVTQSVLSVPSSYKQVALYVQPSCILSVVTSASGRPLTLSDVLSRFLRCESHSQRHNVSSFIQEADDNHPLTRRNDRSNWLRGMDQQSLWPLFRAYLRRSILSGFFVARYRNGAPVVTPDTVQNAIREINKYIRIFSAYAGRSRRSSATVTTPERAITSGNDNSTVAEYTTSDNIDFETIQSILVDLERKIVGVCESFKSFPRKVVRYERVVSSMLWKVQDLSTKLSFIELDLKKARDECFELRKCGTVHSAQRNMLLDTIRRHKRKIEAAKNAANLSRRRAAVANASNSSSNTPRTVQIHNQLVENAYESDTTTLHRTFNEVERLVLKAIGPPLRRPTRPPRDYESEQNPNAATPRQDKVFTAAHATKFRAKCGRFITKTKNYETDMTQLLNEVGIANHVYFNINTEVSAAAIELKNVRKCESQFRQDLKSLSDGLFDCYTLAETKVADLVTRPDVTRQMEEMVCRINSLERGNHDLQNDLNVSHRRYNALKGQMNEAKRVNKRQTLNINELLHRNAELEAEVRLSERRRRSFMNTVRNQLRQVAIDQEQQILNKYREKEEEWKRVNDQLRSQVEDLTEEVSVANRLLKENVSATGGRQCDWTLGTSGLRQNNNGDEATVESDNFDESNDEESRPMLGEVGYESNDEERPLFEGDTYFDSSGDDNNDGENDDDYANNDNDDDVYDNDDDYVNNDDVYDNNDDYYENDDDDDNDDNENDDLENYFDD